MIYHIIYYHKIIYLNSFRIIELIEDIIILMIYFLIILLDIINMLKM